MDTETIYVLLIEDNDDYVRLLKQQLAAADAHRFVIHRVGTLAAGVAEAQTGKAQVILLDLTLPDGDGLETFVRVIEVAPSTPLIVLSGRDDVQLAIETVQLGAQDYLIKGQFDGHLLIRAMHYAVERKRSQLLLRRAHDDLENRVKERTAALQQMNAKLQIEIGERRKAEEATLESNRQLTAALAQVRAGQQELIQRERMLALARMANGMAHDFNNALATILGFSDLLLHRPDAFNDLEKARSYLENIHNAARSSAALVSRLRDFYRYRDEGDIFTPVVVNDLVLNVIALTQPRWKDLAMASGIQIEMRTELENVPTVSGNELELREVFMNLIFNAVDAIPRRGVIVLRTHLEGDRVRVTVSDDGLGMSEEVRSRCLEPFFSTKNDQGMGLGLGSVHGIARRHRGEVQIESQLGHGTSVSVLLPRSAEAAADEEGQTVAEPSAPAALRILVIEDEPLVREVLGVYLAEDDHVVTTVENGREGLRVYEPGKFDVIMTDRAMPEMNGDELASAIKKQSSDQPVILLTGFGDLMSGAGEKPEGVDLIVSKPFTLATLRTAIAKVTAA